MSALLPPLADPTNKAKGVTGQDTPDGDAFWVDYVAHEIGQRLLQLAPRAAG